MSFLLITGIWVEPNPKKKEKSEMARSKDPGFHSSTDPQLFQDHIFNPQDAVVGSLRSGFWQRKAAQVYSLKR